MEFNFVVEFGIIEEDCKTANRLADCFTEVEITVNKQFAPWLFQIPDCL